MLRIYGNTVRIWRYNVGWKMGDVPMQQGCCSQQEVDHLIERLERENQVLKGRKQDGQPPRNRDITIEPIEQAENQWIDGRQFDTLEQAKQALEAGEQAYRPAMSTQQQLAAARAEITNLQLALARLYERSGLTDEVVVS